LIEPLTEGVKMDLWRLKIFCKVIENNSFSKAADAINLSQPTISSHIKDLESHFNCKLIDRLEKKAVPSKAGELLYSYAVRLLTLYEETEAAMSEFHGKIKGHLIIGGSTIPGGYILPGIVAKFMKEYTDVRVSLMIGDTKKIVDDIISGTLQLGVVGAKVNDKRIVQKKLISEEMQVIIPGDHKWSGQKYVRIESLCREPFIRRENGSGTLMTLQTSLAGKGLHIKDLSVVAELGSTESIIKGIKSNIGVSVLSPIAVSEDLKSGTLKALKVRGLNLERTFYLTRYKNRSESPLSRTFRIFTESNFLSGNFKKKGK
jgi:DNA-binding transcriptional LysR family regulator